MDYVTIPNVEIASAGMEWPTANGPLTVRMDHLADAARAANDDPLIQPPRIKIGHTDPRFNSDEAREKDHDPFADFDGEPAVGVVRNLRVANDGAVLLGDYTEVPRWLAEALPSAFPNRSMEGSYSVKPGPAGEPQGTWEVRTEGGNRYSLVITAVALLGVERPAVRDLADLQRFLVAGEGLVVTGTEPEPVAAKAAAQMRASIDTVIDQFIFEWATGDRKYWWPREVWTDPNEIIADDDEGSLYRIPFNSDDEQGIRIGEPIQVVQTFEDAPAAALAASIRKGGKSLARFETRDAAVGDREGGVSGSATNPSMDPAAELRKVLGLSASASDDEVKSALAAREGDEETGNGEGGETGAPVSQPGPETETGDGEGDGETPAEGEGETPAEPEGEGAEASTVTVDRATWRETQRQAREGAEARGEQRRSARDQVIASAVEDGKFPPYRADHYRGLYDSDPEGTEQLIANLADGLVPVDERGSSRDPAEAGGNAYAVTDEEMVRLFGNAYTPRESA